MDQSKQDRLCQALEVDGCGGEQGLDFHVFETAPGGSGHAVQGLGQPVHTFDQPAVTGGEVGFVGPPRQPFSASTQVRQASAPARKQRPDLVAERGVITFLRGQRTLSRAAS